jgi:hypothetical protein
MDRAHSPNIEESKFLPTRFFKHGIKCPLPNKWRSGKTWEEPELAEDNLRKRPITRAETFSACYYSRIGEMLGEDRRTTRETDNGKEPKIKPTSVEKLEEHLREREEEWSDKEIKRKTTRSSLGVILHDIFTEAVWLKDITVAGIDYQPPRRAFSAYLSLKMEDGSLEGDKVGEDNKLILHPLQNVTRRLDHQPNFIC